MTNQFSSFDQLDLASSSLMGKPVNEKKSEVWLLPLIQSREDEGEFPPQPRVETKAGSALGKQETLFQLLHNTVVTA